MPGEAWMGAAGGFRQAEQDQMSNQYMLGQIAMQPDLARLSRAKASLAEQQAESMQRFSSMTQANPTNDPWRMAEMAFASGRPDAYKLANTASQIDYRRQAGETQALRAGQIQVQTRLGMLDLQSRLFSAADNDDSWQQAASDFERQTGQRSGILDQQGNVVIPYSPEAKGRIMAQSMAAKDRLILDWRNRALQSAERERSSKQHSREFWQNFDNQRKREESRAQGRVAGHGDTSLFPTNSQVGLGADLVAERFGVDSKEPWARVMGREVIDKAKRLRNLNPALSASEALDEAFKQMDKAGDFGGHRLVDKKADLARPMPLPESGKADDLKAGQLYTDGQVTREWSGKGWSTPTQRIKNTGYEVDEAAARKALGIGLDDEVDSSTEDDNEEE